MESMERMGRREVTGIPGDGIYIYIYRKDITWDVMLKM